MDIVELLERRDELGLSLLKEKYADYCYGIIFRLLEDRELSEEALSDVWLAIWNAIPPARPARLRPYLAKTARNIAVDYIKRERAQKWDGMTVLLDELAECIPDPATEESGELKTILREFVETLEPEAKRVFVRRYWYGESLGEIAAAVHSTENRIAGILFRTRKKLKAHLEKEGYKV